jgi:FtsP/CotA-like multicopper oxidase with cupredoxin domain
MRKILLTILGILPAVIFGQIDTTFQLVSKMDISAQFELHDGELIEVMGFTRLIGAPIDVPGPTILLEEGDSVKIDLWNLSQGADHTIHLHGLDVDQQNDGVPMLSFSVPHDEIRSYYLKVPHPGTYLYHCHETSVLHVQAGMYGMLVVKPKDDANHTWSGGYEYIDEQNWLMSEIDIDWHHDTIINHGPLPVMDEHVVLDYDPTYFLVNGRSEGQLDSSELVLTGYAGSNSVLRLANIGYYGNEVILPSELNAKIISSDGRVLPQEVTSDTILILPGERYTILVNSNERFSGNAIINYFNLNTGEIENVQEPKIDIDYALSIGEVIQNDVEVYPNPTTGIVYIKTEAQIEQLQVIDMDGRIVLERFNLSPNDKIDLSSLSGGLYFVQLEQNNKIITNKITLNK